MRPALPSPDMIAAALVACCKAFGEDPEYVAGGGDPNSIAAWHAVEALLRVHMHGEAARWRPPYAELAIACGLDWTWANATPREVLQWTRADPRWNPALVELAMCKAAAVRDRELGHG